MVVQLTPGQREVLRHIAAGLGPEATNTQRAAARVLSARDLATVKGRGATWSSAVTVAGLHVLEHDEYPPRHPRRVAADKVAAKRAREVAAQQAQEAAAAQQAAAAVTPPTVRAATPATPKPSRRRASATPTPEPPAIASPAEVRRRGRRPAGDELFDVRNPDPYDEKVLITVKEAAWMLSLPEGAIRQAVADQDLQRVFIGAGAKNYRIVYGSLLAWVSAMPTEASRRRWWW
ncbi:hypothetical protein ACT17Q_14885 [Cellulomonas sp. CW35]|uniref:hypothetical protein n=1 Tax=Cellulomonas sp. CW35 TaxID=3458249 RepID=UPI0040339076